MNLMEAVGGIILVGVFVACAVERLWIASNGRQVMEIGDTVTKTSDASFRGTVVQLPRSVGRKRPRALVASLGGENWVPLDELALAPQGKNE